MEALRRSWSLRLALAYLALRKCDGAAPAAWAFELFWRSLEEPRVQDRWSKLNAALNGIYLAVGQNRDLAAVSQFEKSVREMACSRDRNHTCNSLIPADSKERQDAS